MNLNRDISIIEKIYNYCNEIDEAHNTFNKSYDNFKVNSVYKNAVCLCLMQIGELTNNLSEDFKNLRKLLVAISISKCRLVRQVLKLHLLLNRRE